MLTWYVVLILMSPPHGYSHSLLPVASAEDCAFKGKMWVTEMRIVHNPDFSGGKVLIRKADFKCIQL